MICRVIVTAGEPLSSVNIWEEFLVKSKWEALVIFVGANHDEPEWTMMNQGGVSKNQT